MRYTKLEPLKRRIRYIKQVTDDKGRISKRSKVVSYWDTFNFPRLAFFIGVVLGFIILGVTI